MPIVLYLVVLAINFRDRPPSAEALAFEPTLRDVAETSQMRTMHTSTCLASGAARRRSGTDRRRARGLDSQDRDDESLSRDRIPILGTRPSRGLCTSLKRYGNLCLRPPDAHCFDALEGARDRVERASRGRSMADRTLPANASPTARGPTSPRATSSTHVPNSRRRSIAHCFTSRAWLRAAQATATAYGRARCGPRILAPRSLRDSISCSARDRGGLRPRAPRLGQLDIAPPAARGSSRGDSRVVAPAAVGRGALAGARVPL